MKRIIILVVAFALFGSSWTCLARDLESPLFGARLDATKKDWERNSAPKRAGNDDPALTPVSLNPLSFCVGSLCLASYCLGSLCVSSECVGSGCVGSTCVGSGCASSMCAASGCVGSICGGSACLGVTLCLKACGEDGGPASDLGPNYDNLTCTWGPCR